MFAIIRSGGKQFRITEKARIRVPRIDAAIGDEVIFDDVLLLSSEGETHVGRPTVKGAGVTAEVLQHGLEEKIVIFKYKRRKNERKKAGHRQGFTEVLVRKISLHPEEKSAEEPVGEKTSEKAADEETSAE